MSPSLLLTVLLISKVPIAFKVCVSDIAQLFACVCVCVRKGQRACEDSSHTHCLLFLSTFPLAHYSCRSKLCRKELKNREEFLIWLSSSTLLATKFACPLAAFTLKNSAYKAILLLHTHSLYQLLCSHGVP